ncbi:hypothetical protein L1049_012497 [Liquidambar formosana]|uniref:Serine carboxypeptidase-like 18 n=1 Tax=Liquidambar formosana TaxID=63359 RepID=A0AAP0N304_LIQFO
MVLEAARKHRLTLLNWIMALPAAALLVLVFLVVPISSSTIIATLPGYTGDLPFTLETGYVGVGENEEAQLFYYFVESQRSPKEDPLMLWITGGPGCSSLVGFMFENGPLSFTYEDYSGGLPTLHVNPYAWTQNLNILYLDAPVGTGFSYSVTSEGYHVDDRTFVAHAYEFLQKWMMNHTEYLENQLYIGGDSYSGTPIPMLVQDILDGVGSGPLFNLKGYVLGNPVTDSFIDDNSRIPFAHRLTLIPDDLYKEAEKSCHGDFVNVDPNNKQCAVDILAIDELVRQINEEQVLEPACSNTAPQPDDAILSRRFLKQNSKHLFRSLPTAPSHWCRSYNMALCTIWANNAAVQEALNVRNGSKSEWEVCISIDNYTEDVSSTLEYHRNLSKANLQALIYSGDHDMSIPHIGTQEWISSLNLTLNDVWRAWFVDGQVAGYTKKYKNNDYSLTFATVKGAGHFAAMYKIEECSAMVDRWLAHFPL